MVHGSKQKVFVWILTKLVFVAFLLTTAGCKESDADASHGIKDDGQEIEELAVRVIEAEDATREGCFITEEMDEASGQAVIVPGQAVCSVVDKSGKVPKPQGRLRFSLDVPKAKTVAVWTRVYWKGTCSNSFLVVLPEGKKAIASGTTYGQWRWEQVARETKLTKGANELLVEAREFDTSIDQILVTDDLQYTPQGQEADNPPVAANETPRLFLQK